MHYMVILNNLRVGDDVINAKDIANLLSKHNLWLFSPHTAKVRSLKAGDALLVYLAGKSNRVFVGTFKLNSKPAPLEEATPDELKPLAKYYSLAAPIEDVILWEKPKPIVELLPRLSFITDKKNYGLHLRQGLRQIPEEDFEVVVATLK